MMNAIFLGLTLASAASAQIAVNGFNMVSYPSGAPTMAPQAAPYAPPSNGYASQPAYAAPSASAAASSSNGYGYGYAAASSSNGYGYAAPAASSMAAASSSMMSAPPSSYTPPPQAQYTTMAYSSFQGGGYKSMDCGYGFTKAADGSCQQQQWVRFHCFPEMSVYGTDVLMMGSRHSIPPRVAINRLRKLARSLCCRRC